jgi:peroxiredoxin
MLMPGVHAPEFALPDLAGGTKRSADYLQQGPTLFVFYKTSCPICQLTLPFLQRINDGVSLRIVLISQDDANKAEKFGEKFSLSMDTVIDARGYPASNAYRIESVPSLFLVRQDGMIERSWSGFSKEDMEALASYADQPMFQSDENVPVFRPG